MERKFGWNVNLCAIRTLKILFLCILLCSSHFRAVSLLNHRTITTRNAPSHFQYIHSPVNACEEKVFLLSVVCSSIDHFEQREAIRKTWGTATWNRTMDVKVVFMLGLHEKLTVNTSSHLEKEIQLHQDIIQGGFVDSYANLSLKTIHVLNWIEKHCSKAVFVLKTDDDVFINIPVLLKDLHNTVHRHFIMGATIAGAQPIRDKTSKWYTAIEDYSKNMYPTYLSGSAYVISGDAVSDLLNASLRVDLFWLEDVFITGFCAKMAELKHIYNAKFGFKRRLLSPCLFRLVITSHRVTPIEMVKVWREMQKVSLICDYLRLHLDVVT